MMAVTSSLSDEQRAVLALWTEVNASLSAYHKLITSFGTAELAWYAKVDAWRQLGIHHSHLARHEQPEQTQASIDKIQQALIEGRYGLLFADQPDYPAQLSQIYDPPPLLFYRGNKARLRQAQIAIVGSRKPTAHAQKITFDIAQYLAQAGYIITSGLAMGVDKRAHLGALAQADAEYQGRTIGVMGTGIEVNYPNHHDKLFAQIIEQGGCIISELLPHTMPHKHTFPRRNRLVAGLSLATIVTEATIQSGSLITARLTSEQGKQVFAIPSHIDNSNAEGCHHLIREGATLIYHPQQVLEDINSQLPYNSHSFQSNVLSTLNRSQTENPLENVSSSTADTGKLASSNIKPSPSAIVVPEHLTLVYEQLDWHGQDLDALIIATKLATPQLIGQLMELELLGVISVQGGRYLRV
ncbi:MULTISPECIES: DNA-processing protein DprA [unclassified Psychrobacter]|uniref:DNA-processing protein DprA n=1 Tax=unclassified Psychrobacter TaxID=196806 RepID=UPI000ED2CC0C|nr:MULTISPECIES: DNA-processing protein DprA [unclassified Psychrobacter]MBE8610150.1 DNA-protecting protein DprA [Pseudomonas lundensis]HCI74938.1 DNA-protecting protein DprA [Psychrobacter sp.]